ncbi:MAG: alpha-xylosidase [Clostridia bacterium]|nr:alpha-xylosidase [Clostridia bacterium]
MKFTNGCWVDAENTAIFSPAQVYEHTVEPERVRLVCPTGRIASRGATLGGVVLTVEITAPAEGVLRVRTYHYAGALNCGPAFDLVEAQTGWLKTEEKDGSIIARSGELAAEIDIESARVVFTHAGRRVTALEDRGLSYVKTAWGGRDGLYYDPSSEDAWMRAQLSLAVNEHIYGLGERFGAFVHNGQSVDLWNEDGGTSTDIAYKNVPFFLSSRGYGVFVNHPGRVSFEIGSENVSKTGFAVKGEALDFFLFDGPGPKDVLARYTALTGRPPLPAPWTFGLWLSTSFTTNYDEQTVSSFVDGMAERGIPLSVFHFDCFWMRAFRWCDFEFDPAMFPDPAGMLARLKEKGLRICLWINPYVGQESPLFEEGAKAGYFLKRRDGSVWQWDMWQPGLAIVDFTNPDARAWYAGKLRRLVDLGADCFKTDFGERIPADAVYFDGSDPEKMHNYYAYLYNKTVHDALAEKKGEDEAFLFARSATAGSQKFPVHWGGDCWSTYEAMEQTLRGGLSLTSSGFGFWSHDIGGFERRSTADIYKRWLAFGLLSSHSRLHGSDSVRVPWSYDEEAVDVARFFTRLKMRLMPYIYSAAREAHETGAPVMRAMMLEFPEDRNCDYLATQYMFGESLLVAPVLNDESRAEYYLPEGRWTHLLTGDEREGGRWYAERCGYMSVPLFARAGSIIPVGARDDGPDYDYADGVTFFCYARSGENRVYSGGAEVTGRDGAVSCSIALSGDAAGCAVKFEGDRPCRVVLVHAGIPKAVEGAAFELPRDGLMLTLEMQPDDLVLAFDGAGTATIRF